MANKQLIPFGSFDPVKNQPDDPSTAVKVNGQWTGGPNIGTVRHNGNGGGGGGNSGQGILSAFLPGQLAGIAGPLSKSFGGTQKNWQGILSQPYSDMQMPQNFQYGNRGKNGNKKHGDQPDDGKVHKPGSVDMPDMSGKPDPFGHDRAVMAAFQSMAPQTQPQASNPAYPMPVPQGLQPTTPQMVSQTGLQPQPNPMFQQPQQQMLSPQVMAMLRQQFGGR